MENSTTKPLFRELAGATALYLTLLPHCLSFFAEDGSVETSHLVGYGFGLCIQQDTTKRPQVKKPTVPLPEIEQILPRVPSKSFRTPPAAMLNLAGSQDHQAPVMTLQVIDSLAKLHPELKDYLLKQGIILGGLQIDSVESETQKQLQRALGGITLPSELEAKLRRNQALYGTTDNPMRPPPPPYQVDLFALMTAISNLLHYIGIK